MEIAIVLFLAVIAWCIWRITDRIAGPSAVTPVVQALARPTLRALFSVLQALAGVVVLVALLFVGYYWVEAMVGKPPPPDAQTAARGTTYMTSPDGTMLHQIPDSDLKRALESGYTITSQDVVRKSLAAEADGAESAARSEKMQLSVLMMVLTPLAFLFGRRLVRSRRDDDEE